MSSLQQGSTFLLYNDRVEEGDTAIIYINPGVKYAIVVRRGQTLHMKYGALRHEFLIGKRYGTPISATAGYVHILRATPHLWTQTLQRRTQILYTPDIGAILLLLDLRPGAVVCETGTGSGSLTHALSTAVAPTGHVFSFDIDEERVEAVRADIKAHGLEEVATITNRDVCQDGFTKSDCCDGVFLDLPSPWLAIDACCKALSCARGGRIVSFSPCIEQVQRFVEALEKHSFICIETVEVVPQKMKIVEVESEMLEESAAFGSNLPATYKGGVATLKKFSNKNGSKKTGTNRKRARWAKEEDKKEEKNDNNNEVVGGGEQQERKDFSITSLDLIPFPVNQPTHTGYLTSATLLPRNVLLSFQQLQFE